MNETYAISGADVLYNTDIFCFSHLRWGFVFQRPQHLLTRIAKHNRVFYFEESVFGNEYKLQIEKNDNNIYIITPHLKNNLSEKEIAEQLKAMVDSVMRSKNIDRYCCWYYTPMALNFTRHLHPDLIIYDCMDELSSFKFAPPILHHLEKELLQKCDVVFTGGYSIYNAKKNLHKNIYPFPSSIDKEHFGQARNITAEQDDQANIPHPRFGFFGVIDERFDINLIESIARSKPNWHFILLGPVVKIDPASLPQLSNIHYLGSKDYKQLPQYLAGWDIAIIPFAINESTKFISPTKTPEYLAGGKPVISSPIKDVVSPYGINNLVHIASDTNSFIQAAEIEFNKKDILQWLKKVDNFLANNSWEETLKQMMLLINKTWKQKKGKSQIKEKIYV